VHFHYHYFTLEQRDALSRQILGLTAEDGERSRAALDSLRSPDYGICEACEADIPFVRLLEDPFQRLCSRCAGG
jgi:RNA polymerase-binding transcription factor DksA